MNGVACRLRRVTRVSLLGLFVHSTSITGIAWGQSAAADSAQYLSLVGVVVGRTDGPIAALRDRRSGREAWYRVGDRIEDLMLSVVTSDRVVLRRADRDIELRMAASQRGGDGRVAAPPGRVIRGRPVPPVAPVQPPRR